MHLLLSRLLVLALFLLGYVMPTGALALGNAGPNNPASPVTETRADANKTSNGQSSAAWWKGRQLNEGKGSQNQIRLGGRAGNESPDKQEKESGTGKTTVETAAKEKAISKPFDWEWDTKSGDQRAKGKQVPYQMLRGKNELADIEDKFIPGGGTATAMFDYEDTVALLGTSRGGGVASPGGGVKTNAGMLTATGISFDRLAFSGAPKKNAGDAAGVAAAKNIGQSFGSHPEVERMKTKANNSAMAASRGSAAGEGSKANERCCFDGFMEYLINVANEEAGAACSSHAVSKTYANVVWMVQQMYKQCFLPMAFLFLLPGAIITQTKSFVKKNMLVESRAPDPDTASPFIGIARAIVAVFLIPATQLAVSYCIDIGNSLEDVCHPYVNLPLIYMWCEEQIQVLDPDQQGKLIKNMPQVPDAPYRGKFAGMPVKGAIMEQMADLDIALMELVNECYHMLTIGLCVISAFQLVIMCYLFLIGPLAAAFYAWPQVGRSLFRQAFSVWLDAVVVLSLWKFWWNVTLVCMTVRLETGGVDPFNPFEVYYLIAFFAILLVMPFNPFDFHGSAIIGFVEQKAAGVVGKVAQGGKSHGAKNSGKSRAKMAGK
jgi:hypothetical protein